MNQTQSRMLHPSEPHRISYRQEGPPRSPIFRGDCSCGDTSGDVTTSGMVAGWEAAHRDTIREERIAARIYADRAYDLADSMGGA